MSVVFWEVDVVGFFDTEIELRLTLVESLALAMEAGELPPPRRLDACAPSDWGFVVRLSCVIQEQLFPRLPFLDDNLPFQLNQKNSTLSQKPSNSQFSPSVPELQTSPGVCRPSWHPNAGRMVKTPCYLCVLCPIQPGEILGSTSQQAL